MNIKSVILKKPDNLDECFKVRYKVFIDEQGFDESIEIDEYDDVAFHVLLTSNGISIATARYFLYNDSYKIGRVCVLKDYRNLKLGNKLLSSIEEHLHSLGVKEVVLHSQYQTKDFYARNGYKEIGDIFYEEGCKHIKMFKCIN